MRRRAIRASLAAAIALWPPAAAAQTAPVTPSSQAVLVYPPSFFASSNPGTAYDMIQRLPGFTLDVGDLDSRGLSGAASNVLIDGSRPSSKSDNVAEVLTRITAASVERIELIRGGAPGIDMRGRATVANVVLKRTPKTELVAEGNLLVYDNGDTGPFAKLAYTRRNGERTTEVSVWQRPTAATRPAAFARATIGRAHLFKPRHSTPSNGSAAMMRAGRSSDRYLGAS